MQLESLLMSITLSGVWWIVLISVNERLGLDSERRQLRSGCKRRPKRLVPDDYADWYFHLLCPRSVSVTVVKELSLLGMFDQQDT